MDPMIQPIYQAMIPEPIKRAIIKDYQSGMSMLKVQQRWSRWPRSLIRSLLQVEGVVRSKAKEEESAPSLEEIERLRDLTKDSWSPEETGSRWVGRRSSKYEEAGKALSRILKR